MSDNQNIDTTTNINETDTNKTSTDHSDDYEKICYVCRRPESKAGEMITMPGGMNFCHECMQKAFDSISKSGMDFSKLQNMPFMNMNLNDFAGMQMPNTEIPEKNKIKKKSKAKDAEKFLTMKDVPAPHQIKAQLDAYVIGQERAKRAVSVAFYNHYKRVILRQQDELRAKDNTEENKLIEVTLNEVAHSIFYAPQYVAIEEGYFEEEGLDLTLVTGFGADKVLTALISGEADIGFMGAEASIYAYQEGATDPAVNFAQLTQRAGNFLVAREKMPDFKWEDLKGEKVLGGRKGGVHISM